ncbi:Putative PPM-type phosphatase, divalent cation binding, protein phosphatase 2C family [Colletotrichum destructivum]|uniref:PPM-type phosphatase, divalent cation binding, protein phosphatase 2C family n=1 Tax=Colletotrichum destructivum TaxID=34406 RepID=A0AAX4HWL4_9PEZI|nr:Putative PPM-type phosphatase, divalent cation binding, protein phosphatase 2C family [Colletotrichum destructivum]
MKPKTTPNFAAFLPRRRQRPQQRQNHCGPIVSDKLYTRNGTLDVFSRFFKLAGSKRRSLSNQGSGLLTRMFGGGSSSAASKAERDPKEDRKSPSPESDKGSAAAIKSSDQAASGDKRSGNSSPPGRQQDGAVDKKRRASGVQGKAAGILAHAKNALNISQVSRTSSDMSSQTPLQKLGKQDPALAVPQGQHNNSAGDSVPGPRSTFRVGVWEDRNKKCRRTMEDTHAFLYNFLHTPAPALEGKKDDSVSDDKETLAQDMIETDNGYFAIFDGHAGTFAADWCGKKLHIILEDIIRKNPNGPIPELLDQTFTSVDAQLEKLPLKNSGCTAAVAVLRWEDRVPSDRSATGSQAIAPATAAATKAAKLTSEEATDDKATSTGGGVEATHAKLKSSASRQRVLYTANVGDARIILCRSGKALRLSYDHKGSDENEGKRIANAGGLILNNRVNGVLAVTRALGDTYMKDLVTGHPYTTETVIQPESDEFIIIACDGLWDVCSDQDAVDLVRNVEDPVEASKLLVDHALNRFSTDNLSCMIVRLDKEALLESQNDKENAIGVERPPANPAKVSEAEKIIRETKQKIAEGGAPAVGVSASNSGRGHDPASIDNGDFKPTTLDGTLEEEPGPIDDGDSPEIEPDAVPAILPATVEQTDAAVAPKKSA